MVVAAGIHLLSLAAGGRWGQEVEVSRQLLEYASRRPQRVFLTDARTLYQMHALGGFKLPSNVTCLDPSEAERRLSLKPEMRLPAGPADALLVNLEGLLYGGWDPRFMRYREQYGGRVETVVPVRYKPLLRPLVALLGARSFTVLSLGGQAVYSLRSAVP